MLMESKFFKEFINKHPVLSIGGAIVGYKALEVGICYVLWPEETANFARKAMSIARDYSSLTAASIAVAQTEIMQAYNHLPHYATNLVINTHRAIQTSRTIPCLSTLVR
jgi:hypothetical protein